ncbi:MAG: hypothetical protein AB7N53_05070 [Candidatus Binatia bacterium]
MAVEDSACDERGQERLTELCEEEHMPAAKKKAVSKAKKKAPAKKKATAKKKK